MPIDPQLIHALHLTTEDHAAAAGDVPHPHHVFQVSTVQALVDSQYDGDMTIGELLAHGDTGLGTLNGLDGELVVVDGRAFVARVDGSVGEVPPATRTPFAVVTPFAPTATASVANLPHADLLAQLDRIRATRVAAVRVRGHFSRMRVRSVPKQQPPYPALDDVTGHQVEWEMGPVSATVVGFRFPAVATGMEVPGWHLHALADDHASGGHVLVADIAHGTIEVDGVTEVHCELPPGVRIVPPRADIEARIHAAENTTHP